MTQTNILWTGREYYSLENCLVSIADTGPEISSTIVGSYEGKIYLVEYLIRTNPNWETVFFDVKCRHSNQTMHLQFEGDGKGNWATNGKAADQFKGCIDLDLPLTPFTNTLPINRLKLSEGSTQEVQVIYLDLLAQNIVPLRQKYVCLTPSTYQYENIPNDFEATIQVDELGLVVDYPPLFVRTARLHSEY